MRFLRSPLARLPLARLPLARLPLVALPLLLACPTSEPTEPAALAFPEGFLWGTAVAGFQVDMGCPTLPAEQCEDRASDWYQWVTDPELLADPSTHLSGDPLSISPGFWETHPEDFARARDVLHNNAVRVSVEWSRLFPTGPDTPDMDAVAHYRGMFEAARAAGLTPMVTLNHYTLPLWLHDGRACHDDPENCSPAGWLDPDTLIPAIAAFSEFCGAQFGDQVDLWATLNEPLAVIFSGYLQPGEDRTNPPGVVVPERALEVLQSQIVAHARMYDAVHIGDTVDADGDGEAAMVGLVPNLAAPRPVDPTNPEDVEGAEHMNYLYNRLYLEGIINGRLDPELDGTLAEPDPDLVGRSDFIGINYYTEVHVQGLSFGLFDAPWFDFLPVGSLWRYSPEGLYEVVMLAAEYDQPIYITENGTADQFYERRGHLVDHLTELHRAIEDGADVRGYFHWSLLDNYEWNHGLDLTFGLFSYDFDTKERTAKPAATVYGEIGAANGLTQSHLDDWGGNDWPDPE